LTIWRTQSLTFVVFCVCSFNVFIALAAPVPVTPHSLLQQHELPDGYYTHTAQDVHFHDNNLRRRTTPHNAVLSAGPKTARRAQNVAEHSPQPIGRRGFFSGLKKAFSKVGNGIKHTVKKVGNGIKQAVKQTVKKAGNVVKHVAQGVKNVAKGVKNAVKKVAQPFVKAASWVKKNGAAIAKVTKAGLKVMSTATSVGSRVASFIPGVGTLVSQGLKAASSGLNKGSNAIPGNLGRFGNVMDKVQHPIGGAGGAVLDAILKRDGVDLAF
jgi:hypothetical protein